MHCSYISDLWKNILNSYFVKKMLMTHLRFYVLWSGCESLSGKLHLADCLEFPRVFHKKVTCARNFDLVVS